MRTSELRTDLLSCPLGIANTSPELTWILLSDQAEDRQTACEVEVDLVPPAGEPLAVWRSGKLALSIGEALSYAGEPLKSRASYRWRVRVWDRAAHAGDWSEWAPFSTGIIAPDKVTASWIAGGGALRKEFPVAEGLVRARAYVSGLGYYEFFCNGGKVSAAALSPSFTEFDLRVEYETIDLTAQLQAGANAVGFVLADGWWRHGKDARARRVNQAIAEIVCEYADGTQTLLVTDTSWQAADGPLPPAEDTSPHQIFDGVALDLGWLASGWCQPGSNQPGWRPAQLAGEGVGALVPTLLPPVRETEIVPPRVVTRLSDSLLAIDFGQNFTGWVRFRARGPKGTRFVIRQAELLEADGRLNPATLRSAKQTDHIQLAGTAEAETVEPRLLYHGFRYAEIEGPIDAIEAGSIEGCVIHSDLPVIGEVTTSDERINWLLNAVRWTVRSNAYSVMTDVCQRDERRGWLLDGASAFKVGILFYDMNSLGRKWIEDMIDNQQEDGSLRADSAPMWFPCKSVGWQRAIVIIPMCIYEAYGDLSFLRRAFPHMRRYADYLANNLQKDLLPEGFSHHPAEWLCIGRRDAQFSDNALAVDILRKVAEASRILAEDGGETYDQTADRIAAATHAKWYDRNCACYVAGEGFSHSSQVYALRFGIVPPEERQRVFDRMVDDLMNARGEGPFVMTGIGSTEHLPIVLSEFGRDDLVWRWLQRNEYPGYGFMQRNGATTIWERWEHITYHQMNAHNHTGLIGIGMWLMQYLVGLNVIPGAEPIFHLRPAVNLPLDSLTTSWNSRWGTVRVQWHTENTTRHLEITIPAGCLGHLQLPGHAELETIQPGTHLLTI